jgi:hypothetical protein
MFSGIRAMLQDWYYVICNTDYQVFLYKVGCGNLVAATYGRSATYTISRRASHRFWYL